jgi:hypothetical protein
MAAQTITYKPVVFHPTLAKSFVRICCELFNRLLPQPSTILSVGLLLMGLGIPFLMAIDLIPTTFFLGFVGLALLGTGGILTLYFVGDF